MRETLQHVDSDVFSKIFNSDTLDLGGERSSKKPTNKAQNEDEDDEEEEDDDEVDAEQVLSRRIPTVHSSDAVDYSDFDETVPDTPKMYSDKYYRRGMDIMQQQKPTLPRSRLHMVSDNYDEDEEEEDDEGHNSPASLPVPPPMLQTPSSFTLNNSTAGIPTKAPTFSSSQNLEQHPPTSALQPIPSTLPVATALVPPSQATNRRKMDSHIKDDPVGTATKQQADIQELFPGFEKGKVLKFSDLFMPNIKRPSKLHPSKKGKQ